MHSEQQQHARSNERPLNNPKQSRSPWSNLQLTVPNNRHHTSIVAFVECVLVELTHEDVGAEYVSSNVWGTKRTQFIAADDVAETFCKRHYDERLGWHETTISRESVRNELIDRLSRTDSLATDRSHSAPVEACDVFSVKPVQQLYNRQP
ncbi:hypothetical protein DEQ92_19680 [Haloferax sp. Atlit-6N]|uniref:DUF8030 domain-containing protein n=1 Tax=Haloferax gibbonsii TaxID=35746 RepID=A0A871BK57_HALGI|nr:hypothetical protein [Haloferax gibbonsii]QOS13392.1 uncharacterized protein HfgLR_20760 [Haloferax gibbonsii]REA00499.1 hypothetical protein DEQ92_19680 [Haloferax sp. Atlit-6N]